MDLEAPDHPAFLAWIDLDEGWGFRPNELQGPPKSRLMARLEVFVLLMSLFSPETFEV